MAWTDRLWPGDRGVLRLIAQADQGGDPFGPLTVGSILAMGRDNANRVCDLVLEGWCELFDHPTERDRSGYPACCVRVTEAGQMALGPRETVH